MDLLDAYNITASGLSAQRMRVRTVAANLANARTTETPQGGAYKRREVTFTAAAVDPFGSALDQQLSGVLVTDIKPDDTPGARVFDPSHPHADADGYLELPNVDVMHEMVDLMAASRTYEANANVLDVTGELASRALEIGGR